MGWVLLTWYLVKEVFVVSLYESSVVYHHGVIENSVNHCPVERNPSEAEGQVHGYS